MSIDLHVHSRDCSDGRLSLPELMEEARNRRIRLISITDHDSVDCQESAEALAFRAGIHYLTGVELSITFSHPASGGGKPVSLDVLGYGIDPLNQALLQKLIELREHRRRRAGKIMENINRELERDGRIPLTPEDLRAIEASVDGAFGRPHIANYLVLIGLVGSRQEAFDRYLVSCNVPKLPLSLEEASVLVRGAGGKLVLAHPNDPSGTSLASLAPSLAGQQQIIADRMLAHLDGVECWHARHDPETTAAYLVFTRRHGLLRTGGSDCHQQPVRLGTVPVPDSVAGQFGITL